MVEIFPCIDICVCGVNLCACIRNGFGGNVLHTLESKLVMTLFFARPYLLN